MVNSYNLKYVVDIDVKTMSLPVQDYAYRMLNFKHSGAVTECYISHIDRLIGMSKSVGHSIIFLEHLVQRLSEHLVASGVYERVDAEVDEPECGKDVVPFTRQLSVLYVLYRVFQKTVPLFYFCDNFRKWTPNLTIFSPLEPQIYDE